MASNTKHVSTRFVFPAKLFVSNEASVCWSLHADAPAWLVESGMQVQIKLPPYIPDFICMSNLTGSVQSSQVKQLSEFMLI